MAAADFIRGVAVRSLFINAYPVHRLCVSDEDLRIRRLRGEPVVGRLGEVVIRFGRFGFPRRQLFLLDREGAFFTDLAFVPWSSRRLLGILERHGWDPTEDDDALHRWPGGVDV